MSFLRYQDYKQTSSAWLRTIPEHWEMGQSRRRFRLRNEPAQEEDEQLTASQKHGIIRQAEFIESEGRRVVEVIKGQDILKHVEPGDFVISMRSFQGGLEYSRVKGSISSAYVMLAPVKQVEPGFFAWLFKSQSYIQALQSTTNLVRDGQALRFSNFCQVDIPIIPDKEQLAIASFLDRETAKIDALIAEQQRLIELLQEKRQAVISHAVTKGLNPNTPMKDSGVEWLGEVPEHWTVCSFRRFIRVAEGQVDPRDEPYAQMPLIAPNHIESRTGVLSYMETAEEQSAESGKYFCDAGDVIYSKIRPALRKACIAPQDCLTSADMYPLKTSERLSSAFLLLLLLSEQFSALAVLESERVAMPKINRDTLGSIPLVIPPRTEQDEICHYITEVTSGIHKLATEATSSIQLMQERRSALISAAVTGQIDVRGLVTEAVGQ